VYPGTHARTHPDRPAVVLAGSGRVTTYAELDERSLRLAHLLADAGLSRGDHVALLTDNQPEAFEVYWAALRSGLYVTAVNWHLTPADVGYILDDCEATALVAAGDGPVAELAAAVIRGAGRVRLALAWGGRVSGYGSYEEALASASTEPLAEQPRGADMLYSSGTTGRPKGVMAPLPDVSVDAPGDALLGLVTGVFGMGEDTRYLSPAPIYHAAPLRFCGGVQSVGGTVVMMERFDPEAALAAIDRYRITHSQWVPTMFVRMLKLPESVRAGLDGASHRVAIHAAAPCPPEVKRAMIDWWGPILVEYYSSTEGNGMTVVGSEEWLRHPGTVGRPLLGAVRICDDEGTLLPPRAVGTVYFERDRRPFEYHNDPDRTAEATHPAEPGWTTTGDVGYLDDEGFLYLTDRKAFMIISGGVNIYPQEIEDALALHPEVADVAVIGVPDPEMGEVVKAVVQPAPGAVPGHALAAEILAFLSGRIAGYKLPRSVDFVEELPRTPTGKLQKGVLRDRYRLVAGTGPATPGGRDRPGLR
jgi:long-chain acyl-CoA synthetase